MTSGSFSHTPLISKRLASILRSLCCILSLSIVVSVNAFAQSSMHDEGGLRQTLTQIITPYKATIGVAISCIEDHDTLTIDNDHHYPMQSVYKLPLGIFAMHLIDEGTLDLDQKVHLTPEDLRPGTWSPLRDRYPKANVDVNIRDLLFYTVSFSDNNACDILFKLVKGTRPVEKYMHHIGIKGISVAATEEEMSKGWDVQYSNWTKPYSMVRLLEGLYNKTFLSEHSTYHLMDLLTSSFNSENRIKGELPKGTTVAHKTGTSNINSQGMTAANNDVGIITLPNGKHLAIAVFVSDSYEKTETNEKIIADITKAAFDAFSSKTK